MDRSGYVAVVGGINMDIQGRCKGPYAAGDSNPGEALMSPGGVGRNIAENLVRLGIRTELVTVFGDDTLSEELYRSCGRLGISTRGAMRLPSTPASQYICILDGGDSCGRLVGAVAAMDSFERLTPQRLEERSGLLDAASLIVVDANLPEASIVWIAERYGRGRPAPSMGHKNPLLALDPVSVAKAARVKSVLGDFTFLKPNRAEASFLSGVPIESNADLPRAAGALRERGVVEVFISLGAEGLYYEGPGRDGTERGILHPPAMELVNVSGAGDAGVAALVWGALSEYPLRDRAGYAVAASTLATASGLTVNDEMNAGRIAELAKGVTYEQIS